jgi:hypothetical protein
VKTRQIITGTLLSVSLVLGGAGLAAADGGSRPAMDRGTVNCERVADRIEHLTARYDRLVDRVFALTIQRDKANAAGQTRKAAGLQRAIDRLVRIQARVDGRLDHFQGIHNALCNTGT